MGVTVVLVFSGCVGADQCGSHRDTGVADAYCGRVARLRRPRERQKARDDWRKDYDLFEYCRWTRLDDATDVYAIELSTHCGSILAILGAKL